MYTQYLQKLKEGQGFIAALDQSGGSTPKALKAYGISPDQYKSQEEMFDLIHKMRTRIITSPSFESGKILAAILFEMTMDRKIGHKYTGDFLLEEKGILPFLKIDKGMEDEENGVQLLKPIPNLDSLLDRALERHIVGTKMRSLIKSANEKGIADLVDQQFQIGRQILAKGLVPIIEPEVDIRMPDKKEAEILLKNQILSQLDQLDPDQKIMLKLSIPSQEDFYSDLSNHPKVLRVVALSGGYSRDEAVDLLKKNPGLIASFSRALVEGLDASQSDQEFHQTLASSVEKIYQASLT